MWSKMSESHFMEEHEGRKDAKASTGDSFSIEFTLALSIRVIAPNLALTHIAADDGID